MGYYDGIAATDEASAHTVARETKTPAVLVVNARGVGNSLGAVIEGFLRHRNESNICGVIFNGLAEARYADMNRVATDAGVRAYGYMPHREEFSIPSRHLGLLTAGEIAGLQNTLVEMGGQAEESLDINGLLALAKTAESFPVEHPQAENRCAKVRLAVAKDEAFCFCYEENLELFAALGCELVFFSPLHDDELPGGIHGLYLCGGYPELHAKTLSENEPMRMSIRTRVMGGLPTIAECGGFLYLHKELDGRPMAGVIEGSAYETKKLQRFGYITLTANGDCVLCKKGETIRAHEFHYWDSTAPGDGFTAHKAGRGHSYPCVHATDSLYAGFPHLYFAANPAFAERFIERMVQYGT